MYEMLYQLKGEVSPDSWNPLVRDLPVGWNTAERGRDGLEERDPIPTP